MPQFSWRTFLFLVLAVASGGQFVQAHDSGSTMPVRLGHIADLHLAARPPVTQEQARRIKALISDLARLDKPDYGLSNTLSGDDFAPIAGQGHAAMMLVTEHSLETSHALKDLVAAGPDALPFLLDALDDPTPTKIVLKHDGFGAMWFAAELDLNPVNPAEKVIHQPRPQTPFGKEQYIDSYTVKVGDVCFVAIGQIVGRSYQAVRYQPTACVVINSPTHDRQLCADVRSIWKTKEPRQKLFDSLLADYATEGIFNGNSLDGWSDGSDSQCAAALRLLFYFENESAQLIADRLNKLDVRNDKSADDSMHRCVANGVRADSFIKAVAWSNNAPVRQALLDIFKRAENGLTVLAALPAVQDNELVHQRLEALLSALPPDTDQDGPYGMGYQYLLALAQRTPATARPAFDRYLKDPHVNRRHTVCRVLAEVKMPWDADLLAPMLTDTRTWGWTHAIAPGQNEPRLPNRLCDVAASTLSANHPEFKFIYAGTYNDMDRQIAAIQKQLAGKVVK